LVHVPQVGMARLGTLDTPGGQRHHAAAACAIRSRASVTKSRRAASSARARAGTIRHFAPRSIHNMIKPACSVTSLKARHQYREVLTLSEPTMPSPLPVRRVPRKVLLSGSQVASR
jgi:hypothetical protein